MSDDQKLYSTKQAAKFLGVSVRTLRYWRKSGKLVPTIKGDTGPGNGAKSARNGAKSARNGAKSARNGAKRATKKSRQTVASAASFSEQTFERGHKDRG